MNYSKHVNGKRVLAVLLTLAMMLTMIPAGVFAAEQDATGIQLDKTELSLYPNETGTLKATVLPEEAADKTVTWTSSEDDIATVDEAGTVTAVKAGTAIITAATAGNAFTAEATVTVKEEPEIAEIYDFDGVQKVVYSKQDLYMSPKFLTQAGGYTELQRITKDDFTITSSDQTIIEDDAITYERIAVTQDFQTGKYYGYISFSVAPEKIARTGKVVITIASKKNPKIKAGKVFNVVGGRMSKDSMNTMPGDVNQLDFELFEGNDSSETRWVSNDTSVATVDKNGTVTSVGNGTCKIFAINGEWSGSCMVNSHENGFYVDGKKVDTIKINSTGERTAIEVSGQTRYLSEHVPVQIWLDGKNATLSTDMLSKNSSIATQVDSTYYATADPSDTVMVGSINRRGKIAPVANGSTELYVVKSFASDIHEIIAQCKVIVTGCKEDAPDPKTKWSQVTEAQFKNASYATLFMKGYQVMCNLADETKFDDYVTEPIEKEKAEFQFTLTGTSVNWTQDDLDKFNTNENKEAYQERLQQGNYFKLKDKEGSVVADGTDGISVLVESQAVEVTGKKGKAVAELEVTVDSAKLKKGQTYSIEVWPFIPAPKKISSLNDGYLYQLFSYTFVVDGEEPVPPVIAATGVKLNKKSASMSINKTLTLTATVTPSNAADKRVTWKSSNSKVAKVSANGNVKAMKAGKATITAATANGKKASCTITVKKPVIAKVKSVAAKRIKGTSNVKVTWKKVKGATGYKVYRAVGKGTYKPVKTTKKTAWKNTSSKWGKTYKYKVRAYKKINGTVYYGKTSKAKTIKVR